MKNKIFQSLFLVIFFCAAQKGSSQGFVNLGFESANISNSTPRGSPISISNGLPGWSAYFTSSTVTNQVTQIIYDGLSLGGRAISVNDTNTYSSFMPIGGKFSAYLFAGSDSFGSYFSATISQTSLVPSSAKALLVDADYDGPNFVVMLGGQVVSMTPLQTFANYTLYGGDISSFAGSVATLAFTKDPYANDHFAALFLDNIQFSSLPIPEPSTLALGAIGALLLGFRHWRILLDKLLQRAPQQEQAIAPECFVTAISVTGR